MTAFTAAEALQLAMEIETNGEAFYNAILERNVVSETTELFEDLAAQERRHYHVFKQMQEKVSPAPDIPDSEYDQYRQYMQIALDRALFSGKDKALLLAEQAQNQETALRAALGFEKDTLLFFYDLREMVSERDRDTITRIIREEKSHVRRLAGMLQEGI